MACKLSKEHTSLAKDVSAFNISLATTKGHYAYTDAMMRKSANNSSKLTILSLN